MMKIISLAVVAATALALSTAAHACTVEAWSTVSKDDATKAYPADTAASFAVSLADVATAGREKSLSVPAECRQMFVNQLGNKNGWNNSTAWSAVGAQIQIPNRMTNAPAQPAATPPMKPASPEPYVSPEMQQRNSAADAARADAALGELARMKEANLITSAEFEKRAKVIVDALNVKLALKADKTYVDDKLALKADKSFVVAELKKKVETSVFDAFLAKFGLGEGHKPVFASKSEVDSLRGVFNQNVLAHNRLLARVTALEQAKQEAGPLPNLPGLTWEWIAIGLGLLLGFIALVRTFGRRR